MELSKSWLAVIFNPSFSYRFTHMLLASSLTSCFVIAGVSSYQWLKNNSMTEELLTALKTSIYTASVLIIIQFFVGDSHGLNTLKYQPAKIAAMEAIWKTGKNIPLVLIGWPNEELKRNDYEITIPSGASLLITHQKDGEIKGLDYFKDTPPVRPLFFGFRIMVGTGILMMITSWMMSYNLWRFNAIKKWQALLLCAMTFSGWVATVSGWYVAEVGRQPWIVTNILRTVDAAAKNVTSTMILSSLISYLVVYLLLILAFCWVVFYLAKKHILKNNGI